MTLMPIFAGQHDPADVADYLVRFDDLLETAETVTLVGIALDGAAQAAGMALGSGSYVAVALNQAVRFWLTCSQPGNPLFGAGLTATITATITTSNSPPRTFQRSVSVFVQQSDGGTAATPLSAVEQLRKQLAEAQAARHKLLTGAAIVDVQRDGRRIRYSQGNAADLDSYIEELTAQIRALDPTGPEATVQPRRRALGVRF